MKLKLRKWSLKRAKSSMMLKNLKTSHIQKICGIGGTCKGARMLYNEMYHKPDSNDAIPVDKIPEIISHFTRGHEFSDEDITILLKNRTR